MIPVVLSLKISVLSLCHKLPSGVTPRLISESLAQKKTPMELKAPIQPKGVSDSD